MEDDEAEDASWFIFESIEMGFYKGTIKRWFNQAKGSFYNDCIKSWKLWNNRHLEVLPPLSQLTNILYLTFAIIPYLTTENYHWISDHFHARQSKQASSALASSNGCHICDNGQCLPSTEHHHLDAAGEWCRGCEH